ncbi:MAG: hypothetical protein ABIP91_02810 [Sphingomicrobium sp.]
MKKILKIRAGNDARTPHFALRAIERRTPRPPRNALAYAAALEILG